MKGIMILSMGLLVNNDNALLSGFFFALLLNMKHLYLYIAPVFFIYLLKNYCLYPKYEPPISLFNRLFRLAKLGSVVILVFALSFFPFIEHLHQVFSNMFPWGRGLLHAYWAPNFWAIYTFMDKVLFLFIKSKIFFFKFYLFFIL